MDYHPYAGNAINQGIHSAAAYEKAHYAEQAQQEGGLIRLANQISEATARIENISTSLGQLSVGLHEPRPEPVSNGTSATPNADSFAARISALLTSVDRLQRAYDSIVR